MAPHVEIFNSGKWNEKLGTRHITGDEDSEGYKNAEGILIKAQLLDDVFAREVSDENGEVCEEHTESSLEEYSGLLEEYKEAMKEKEANL